MGATDKNTRALGVLEPLAFLHAWHAMSWEEGPERRSHATARPSPEEVQAFYDLHRMELQAIFDSAASAGDPS